MLAAALRSQEETTGTLQCAAFPALFFFGYCVLPSHPVCEAPVSASARSTVRVNGESPCNYSAFHFQHGIQQYLRRSTLYYTVGFMLDDSAQL